MDSLQSFLDNLPLGTLIALAGIVGAIIALCNHSIDYLQFAAAIGAVTGGAGVIGGARAASGKGLKRK